MIKGSICQIFTGVNITIFPQHFLRLAGIPRNMFWGKLTGLQITCIQQNLPQHKLQRKENTSCEKKQGVGDINGKHPAE